MNIKDPSTQLLYTTVPLWVQDKLQTRAGTAFIANAQIPSHPNLTLPLLITAAHVVGNGDSVIAEFHLADGENGLPETSIKVQLSRNLFTYDSTLDVAVMLLGPVLNELLSQGKRVFYRGVEKSLVLTLDIWNGFAAIEDVILIGYPSALYDVRHGLPVVRRGITATPVWNDFNGNPIFLIDAAVFPGSSGSPVFLFNQGSYPTENGIALGTRLFFLGILTASMISNTTKESLGLGSVVKSLALFDKLLDKIIAGGANIQ